MQPTQSIRFQLPNDPKIREMQRPITAYEPDAPPAIEVTVKNLDAGTSRKMTLRRHGDHEGHPFYCAWGEELSQ